MPSASLYRLSSLLPTELLHSARGLPDGRGRHPSRPVPGHPGAPSAPRNAVGGAGMTAARDEMAGAGGGHGEGLSLRVPKAWLKAVSGAITVRQRVDARLLETKTSLSTSQTGIESPNRPTVVVGESPPGKFRLTSAAGACIYPGQPFRRVCRRPVATDGGGPTLSAFRSRRRLTRTASLLLW